MARISMSLRPASTAARRMLRPMRPNPLIATRTDITKSPCDFLPTRERSLCRFRHFFGGNAKMFVELLEKRTGAKTAEAQKSPIRADDRIPALPNAGLNRDLDRRSADDRRSLGIPRSQQELQTRYRHDPRPHTPSGQKLLRGDRDRDLRAGRKQRDRSRAAFGGNNLVGAPRAAIVEIEGEAELRNILPRQCEHARAVLILECKLP